MSERRGDGRHGARHRAAGRRTPARTAALLAAPLLLALAACGGGGGAATGPAPATLGQLPAPPAPQPVAQFDTPEYRRSTAAVATGVIQAWQAGWTGAGITIATIDSGIARDNPEFAGRIHPASRDVTGAGRSIDDPRGHGTAVAAVIAAARNDQGIVGLAFGVQVAAMRADSPGSCEDQGCRYGDSAMAAATDAAVAAGARAINISLGGGSAGSVLRNAIARATRAGTVIIVSAGNDAQPEVDSLAQSILAAGDPRLVIVAGGTAADGTLAGFSNRAGSAAGQYVATLAERVRSFDHTGTAFLYSGTSFAAPQVTAAVALLAQAFPALSGAQLVDIVLRSARDAGAPGTDSEYGRGILDIARAFQPVGGTMAAGGAVSLSANGSLGAAFGAGDRLGTALAAVPVTDSYGRPYVANLGPTLGRASPLRLGAALEGASLATAATAVQQGAVGLRLQLRADRRLIRPPLLADSATSHLGLAHRGLDAQAATRQPLRETSIWLDRGALALAAATGPAAAAILPGSSAGGLLAGDGLEGERDSARHARRLAMGAVRRGRLELALAAGEGRRPLPPTAGLARASSESRMVLAAALPGEKLSLAARLTLIDESGASLGTRLSPGFGLMGARSLLVGAAADAALPAGWSLRLAGTHGRHAPQLGPGLLTGAVGLRSTAWSIAADGPAAGGRLAVRLAQPLALDGGLLAFGAGATAAPIAVTHRERVHEAGWTDPSGSLTFTAFHRRRPGHAAGPPDSGAALRFSADF